MEQFVIGAAVTDGDGPFQFLLEFELDNLPYSCVNLRIFFNGSAKGPDKIKISGQLQDVANFRTTPLQYLYKSMYNTVLRHRQTVEYIVQVSIMQLESILILEFNVLAIVFHTMINKFYRHFIFEIDCPSLVKGHLKVTLT